MITAGDGGGGRIFFFGADLCALLLACRSCWNCRRNALVVGLRVGRRARRGSSGGFRGKRKRAQTVGAIVCGLAVAGEGGSEMR